MRKTELRVPLAAVIEATVHRDERGLFWESYRADALEQLIERRFDVVQANTSVSARGVVRGVHFADVPLGQAKLVSVTRGAIIDYVVDLRVGSPTFGQVDSVELDAANARSVFVPEGLGHAFVALEPDTRVTYLVSDVFRPEREHGVNPLDPELGIEFPLPAGELVLSAKDRESPTLADALAAGLLPTWADCTARYAELSSAGGA